MTLPVEFCQTAIGATIEGAKERILGKGGQGDVLEPTPHDQFRECITEETVLFFGPRIKTITTSELAERLAAVPVALMDVREPHEFASGHVPCAVNVPLGQVRARVREFDSSAETYVICQSGHRSATATKQLMKAGFTNVASVRGGTSAWTGRLKK